MPGHGFSELKTVAGVPGHGVGVPDSIRQFGEGNLAGGRTKKSARSTLNMLNLQEFSRAQRRIGFGRDSFAA